ncbi:unnamed protein product [Periconia digitata]|uniref:Uncharacterized protein n=1 Tax=Periconia digitata TaxID=1303443 RepID=A0A9W4XHZ4_9PLEO|nr:unnamed protein product [Periconia digitata]
MLWSTTVLFFIPNREGNSQLVLISPLPGTCKGGSGDVLRSDGCGLLFPRDAWAGMMTNFMLYGRLFSLGGLFHSDFPAYLHASYSIRVWTRCVCVPVLAPSHAIAVT